LVFQADIIGVPFKKNATVRRPARVLERVGRGQS